jgi:hypothetical protein
VDYFPHEEATVRRMLGSVLVLVSIASCTGGEPKASRTPPTAPPSKSETATHTPSGFAVLDSSWVGEDDGWVLGGAQCGNKTCLVLMKTSDGGRTWTKMRRPPGGPPSSRLKDDCQDPCVSSIRFATPRIGFAFGPAFHESGDGGQSWRIASGRPAWNVEISDRRVYRVVSRMSGCPGPCSISLQVSDVGEGIWRALPTPHRDASRTGLVARAPRIYLAVYANPAGGAGDAHTLFLRSLDAGETWDSFPDPCGDGPQGENDAVSFAAGPAGFLAVLCQSRMHSDVTFVRTSIDAGRTFGTRHTVPSGAGTTIAAGSARTLLVTGIAGGRFQALVSRDGGQTWRATLSIPAREGDAGTWFADFQSARTARVAFGGPSIWTTRDAGATWSRSDPF